VPRIGVCLFAVVLAGVALGQPKENPEAFTFDPKPTTLQPPLPIWWNVAVSPDGATIVTAHGLERGGEWWVWDAKTGAVTAKVAEPNVVRFVCFSPDGSLVATANFDNAVRIYDAKTHKLIAYGHQATGGHTGGVNAIAFSADGALLASAGLDKTARVWNVAEAVARHRGAEGNPTVSIPPRIVFEGFEQSVYSVALSPDGKKLVTGGQDGSVRLERVADDPCGIGPLAHVQRQGRAIGCELGPAGRLKPQRYAKHVSIERYGPLHIAHVDNRIADAH